MRKYLTWTMFAALLAAFAASATKAAPLSVELVVLKNVKSPLSAVLTTKQIKDIYLGRIQSVDGTRIVPLNLQDTEIFGAFAQQFLGMSISAYKSYWIKKLLSEGGNAPKMLESTDEMLQGVSQNPGGVGYLRLQDFKQRTEKAQGLGVVQAQTTKR